MTTKVSEVEDAEKGEPGKKNCAEKRNDSYAKQEYHARDKTVKKMSRDGLTEEKLNSGVHPDRARERWKSGFSKNRRRLPFLLVRQENREKNSMKKRRKRQRYIANTERKRERFAGRKNRIRLFSLKKQKTARPWKHLRQNLRFRLKLLEREKKRGSVQRTSTVALRNTPCVPEISGDIRQEENPMRKRQRRFPMPIRKRWCRIMHEKGKKNQKIPL